jgi:tetratricopeptide (TPR) repeat protein
MKRFHRGKQKVTTKGSNLRTNKFVDGVGRKDRLGWNQVFSCGLTSRLNSIPVMPNPTSRSVQPSRTIRISRDQAIGYLQDGLKISPEDSVAHSLLAVFYREDHRYSDSITESKKAIAISPLNPAFHLVLAITFEDSQRYEEAIAESQDAIQLRHNYATAYYHLAMSQERAGDPHAAEQSWRAFLRISGSKPTNSEEVRIAREHLARISGQ